MLNDLPSQTFLIKAMRTIHRFLHEIQQALFEVRVTSALMNLMGTVLFSVGVALGRGISHGVNSKGRKPLVMRMSPPDCHAMYFDKVARLRQRGFKPLIAHLTALWEFKMIIIGSLGYGLQNVVKSILIK